MIIANLNNPMHSLSNITGYNYLIQYSFMKGLFQLCLGFTDFLCWLCALCVFQRSPRLTCLKAFRASHRRASFRIMCRSESCSVTPSLLALKPAKSLLRIASCSPLRSTLPYSLKAGGRTNAHSPLNCSLPSRTLLLTPQLSATTYAIGAAAE